MSLGWELVTVVDAENPVLGDIRIVNGRIARLPDRRASIAQACTVVLNWWLGESSFDTSRGVDYLSVLGKIGVKEATIRALLSRPLRRVAGVRDVASMDVAIDRATGACTVTDVVVRTVDGELVDVPGTFARTF